MIKIIKLIFDYKLIIILAKGAVTTIFFALILLLLKLTLSYMTGIFGPLWILDYITYFHEGYCLIIFIISCVIDIRKLVMSAKRRRRKIS